MLLVHFNIKQPLLQQVLTFDIVFLFLVYVQSWKGLGYFLAKIRRDSSYFVTLLIRRRFL